MSRVWAILGFTAAALLAGAGAYLWWTASPAADETSLAAALALAPEADGRIALAQPRRAARWLLRHPQALGLLAVAAPEARASWPQLQPAVRPLLDGAQGPLVAWWKGRALAVATRLSPGAISALPLLATRQGLAYDVAGDVARVATDATLLGPREEAATTPAGSARLAALADTGGRRWRLTASRSRLDAVAGVDVGLPEGPGPSQAETLSASPLVGSLGVPVGTTPIAARAVFGAADGWAVTLTGVSLPRFVRDAAGGPEQPTGEARARRWNGFLGEVWLRSAGDRLSIGTSEALLAQVEPPPAGEQGRVNGRDVAWLASDLATALARLPLFDREARSLRALGAQAAGVELVRWRTTAAGARVELQW
jgi:hypothetical protein